MKSKATLSFSRRDLLLGAAALTNARFVPALAAQDAPVGAANSGPPFAYIGCYTSSTGGRGISIYHIDANTNQMNLVQTVGPVNSPSFIILDAAKRFLYSGNEGGGSASAFAINQQTGNLRFLGSQSASGSPAHIIVHPAGKHVMTANYGGSTVTVFPIQADGSLGAATQVIQHSG